MYDPTNTIAELERKTITALQNTVARYQNGETGYSEFKGAVIAIWEISAGLLGEPVQAVVDEVLSGLNDVERNHVAVIYDINARNLLIMTLAEKAKEVVIFSFLELKEYKYPFNKRSEAKAQFNFMLHSWQDSKTHQVIAVDEVLK